uniref:Uncharacterized protein n=1 Tax=Rhizophora mucronata TaxID=61149 RepID=A0A2P2N6Q8_RHIMU
MCLIRHNECGRKGEIVIELELQLFYLQT